MQQWSTFPLLWLKGKLHAQFNWIISAILMKKMGHLLFLKYFCLGFNVEHSYNRRVCGRVKMSTYQHFDV